MQSKATFTRIHNHIKTLINTYNRMQISLGNIAFKLVTRRSNSQQNAPILQRAVVRGEKERAGKSEKEGGRVGDNAREGESHEPTN